MPINIQFEPMPFLQVMGSWWGQRRQMKHQVALQEAQMNLQHQQVAQQSLHSGMTGLRQGLGAYQQQQQFEAQLAQQIEMQQAQFEHAFAMADYKLTGMRPGELKASRDIEIGRGTIPAGTTLSGYRRKVATQQLKLTQDPVYNRQRDMWSLEQTGMPYATAVENAGALDVPTHEYIQQIRAGRQAQQAQIQQAQAVRAEQLGAAINWASSAQKTPDSYKRYIAARETMLGAAQNHFDPQLKLDPSQYPAARQKFQAEAQQAADAFIRDHRSSQPNQAARQAEFEASVLTAPIDGTSEKVTVVPRGDGRYQIVHSRPEAPGTEAPKLDPIYERADKLARETMVPDPEHPDEMVRITDPAAIAVERNKLYQERLLAAEARKPAPPGYSLTGPQVQAASPAPGQEIPRHWEPADQARQTISQLLAKQKAGQELTAEERQAFAEAERILNPELSPRPWTAGQLAELDQARATVRRFLAMRAAGQQLTKQQREEWRIARAILAGAE